mgnify:CR=1 FL=1|tara:strand:+ start:9353 stop:9796 length:444 start_codon:yes stop_codon:yes gene_type:complete
MMKSKAERMSEARIRIHRRKKEQAERSISNRPVRMRMTNEQRIQRFKDSLDPNLLGDSFVLAKIDTLFLGCGSCKSSVRMVMNRWDIDEEPETLMVKIDRVANTIYSKQRTETQKHLTVKDVAVQIIEHIETRRLAIRTLATEAVVQ